MLISSSGNETENIGNARVVCLMFQLNRRSEISDGFSIGFHREINRYKENITNNKGTKGT